MPSFSELPPGLPAPVDDGRADHLVRQRLPSMELTSTASPPVDISSLDGCVILYIYPMTGRQGVPLPDGWDALPGARGCTPESCGFRDHFADLRAAGATWVFGLSSQAADEQGEAAERLHLPFPLLSDPCFTFADLLRLPSFTLGGRRYLSRLTLVIRESVIEHAFYPVFPPDTHAASVLSWLRTNPA